MKRTASVAALAAFAISLAACDNPSVPKPDMSRAAPASAPAAPAASPPAAAVVPVASPQQQLYADMALSSKVKDVLQEPERSHVEVAAADGVVTLYGTVDGPSDKQRVALMAMNVDGVRSVINNLVVVRGSS